VESILAADEKNVKKVVTTETVPAKDAGSAPAKGQQSSASPETNKGTWASMLKK